MRYATTGNIGCVFLFDHGNRSPKLSLGGRATTHAPVAVSTARSVSMRERAIECARIAYDNKGRDILVLDMHGVVDWVEYLVIATGSSRRQIVSIADDAGNYLESLGQRRIAEEGREPGNWVALDYDEIVIHVFDDDMRDFYQLEHLWDNAARVEWADESRRQVHESMHLA